MPVLKQDRSTQAGHFRDLLFLGLPFLVGMLLTVVAGIRYQNVPFLIACIIVLMVLAGVGMVRQMRRSLRFHCPTCGGLIPRTTGKLEGEITFLCGPCDTEWDTGFREGGD